MAGLEHIHWAAALAALLLAGADSDSAGFVFLSAMRTKFDIVREVRRF